MALKESEGILPGTPLTAEDGSVVVSVCASVLADSDGFVSMIVEPSVGVDPLPVEPSVGVDPLTVEPSVGVDPVVEQHPLQWQWHWSDSGATVELSVGVGATVEPSL